MIPHIDRPFQKSYKVSTPPTGKQWVIPDTHGCLLTLQALLEQLNFTKKDQNQNVAV